MGAAVITISAPYGTGGGTIGPALAERLAVPFVDRAIPVAVAQALAVSVDEVLAREERAETRLQRVLAALASSGIPWGPEPTALGTQFDERVYREETERVIARVADTTGGVILGRAAVVVLRDHPTALHVCLRGSFERRLERAVAQSGDDEATVRRFLEEADRNRAAFFRQLYKADPDDPRLYQLVIDATVLDEDTVVEIVVAAAHDRRRPLR
jgi:cytidylate kinase